MSNALLWAPRVLTILFSLLLSTSPWMCSARGSGSGE